MVDAGTQGADGVDEMVEIYVRCLRERGLYENLATYCSLLTGQKKIKVFALQLAGKCTISHFSHGDGRGGGVNVQDEL